MPVLLTYNNENDQGCTDTLAPLSYGLIPLLFVNMVHVPFFYLPFAFTIIHRSRRPAKKKRGRPGSIDHVSGHDVDAGGEGPIFKYIRSKLESKFLTGQDE